MRENQVFMSIGCEKYCIFMAKTKLIASVYQREQNILYEYNTIRMNSMLDMFYLLCFCLFIVIIIIILNRLDYK